MLIKLQLKRVLIRLSLSTVILHMIHTNPSPKIITITAVDSHTERDSLVSALGIAFEMQIQDQIRSR
jgi:hypothetical protein